MIGDTIGRYRLVSRLGEGGMGLVYLAKDTREHSRVALKILPTGTSGDPDRMARFEQEALAVAELSHPNIIDLYAMETFEKPAGPVTLLTMEYVEGQPLSARLGRIGMSLSQFLRIAVQITEGLHYAHRHGVLHRELTPDNIMVTSEGEVKLLDFGLAQLVRPGADDLKNSGVIPAAEPSAPRRVPGTPAYLSPEQIEGRALDARSDLFSLGAVFHEMLTGVRPFLGPRRSEVKHAVLHHDPPLITGSHPEIPERLALLVQRCLAKNPGERFATALEVKEELEAIAAQSA